MYWVIVAAFNTFRYLTIEAVPSGVTVAVRVGHISSIASTSARDFRGSTVAIVCGSADQR